MLKVVVGCSGLRCRHESVKFLMKNSWRPGMSRVYVFDPSPALGPKYSLSKVS